MAEQGNRIATTEGLLGRVSFVLQLFSQDLLDNGLKSTHSLYDVSVITLSEDEDEKMFTLVVSGVLKDTFPRRMGVSLTLTYTIKGGADGWERVVSN